MGNFEPYYVKQGDSGVFAEIINATFQLIPEYQPKYVFGHSNEGLWAGFKSGHVDAASNVFDSVAVDGCLSAPIFRFRDVAVSKANSHLVINQIDDFKEKSIVTFQGARGFLGEEFSLAITGAYLEVAKPELQLRMLLADRYQVSVGDMFIFLQAIKNLNDKNIRPQDFTFHTVFKPVYSRMAFHDKSLCKKFNLAFEQIKQSGQYEEIYQSYLQRLDYR
ncbi:transporter substrate-binding domain-containing protein [Dasania sp. GY-MA-18]|uniref:Transporter substrate-binding domain-containing protein n=1 Tax=Dasania phycosphaerae TaxID=2950436 RepID=A0A9J6RHN2_9GAMM|nr:MULTISPECIES: transporter substrate-binding domain-containing protein [Dasania]MCR8921348.1 transporter substrate-binding domain-containing protein [Dasania sp. GY-MA-18]MCZ0863776.1 transporter substrate-binding domain-containing protein [Dasania phycosphaerae]MCZ0867504.1 transporter substrate-binding domain-containing protein [Dasania phycosphaerae]